MRSVISFTEWKFKHERAGELIWASGLGELAIPVGSDEYFEALGDQLWTPNALADEGEEIMLDVFFRGASLPASHYVGLVAGSPAETTTLATMTEVSGTGYARIALAKNSTDWPTLALDTGDFQAVSLGKVFTASGTWTGATNSFLTGAASGTSGDFIAYAPLGATRTLISSDTLTVTTRVKLA